MRKKEVPYLSPWTYEDKIFESEDIGELVGFVYEIFNTLTGKKYLGRKIFRSAKREVSKEGKVKRSKVESDWKKYFGSSADIKKDVLTFGKDKFIRKILYLCRSKSEMAYFEGKAIFETDCLIREDYYNAWLTCRINGRNLRALSDEYALEHDIIGNSGQQGS